MMNIEKILEEMTLEEKAGLCSGADLWHTKAIKRLGVPSVKMSDGPHGLRTQNEEGDSLGLTSSIEAVCFPSGAGLASSFDRELMREVGDTLGKEARAEGVHTLLGPAVNIKRSPLCGRNFEYLSEDPYLAGELAASYVNAVQKNGVGTSVKHFAANNQEYRRMSITAEVSERALREIYLANFETVVKKAHPWTIMCSYNRINGTYSCENKWLLTDVLRKEWGFDGIVMTDWGAMNQRCKALLAGLNLEMPSSNGENDKLIVEAVKDGRLDESLLDSAVKELLCWIQKAVEGAEIPSAGYDKEEDHKLAQKAAAECAVLLKNDGILPLHKEDRIAFIGAFAAKPRYQGGGSSHINSYKVTSALDAVAGNPNIIYAKGFDCEGEEENAEWFREAVEVAKGAKAAVVFAGLPESFESEGYDRTHLELPSVQNKLIEAIAEVQPNIVVLLHNGSPVTMPWLSKVKGLIDLYLGGEAVGEAAISLLFGDVNPSGKLAETFPLRIEDTPCYLDFPGNERQVRYSEDVYVGYRYYDTKKVPVLFPFGFGLSYTTFQLGSIRLSGRNITDQDTLTVTVKVKNTGKSAGKEVVQLYIAPPKDVKMRRPFKELKGFAKVALNPGEQKDVTFTLNKRSFAYYEERIHDWYVENGTYTIMVGNSSVNLPLCEDVKVVGTAKLPLIVDDTTTCGDVFDYAAKPEVIDGILKRTSFLSTEDDGALGSGTAEALRSMLDGLPLHSLISFSHTTREELADVISQLQDQKNTIN